MLEGVLISITIWAVIIYVSIRIGRKIPTTIKRLRNVDYKNNKIDVEPNRIINTIVKFLTHIRLY